MPAHTIPPPPVSDRYRLMVRTRHGWSPSRETFRSRRQAREAGLWLIAQAGVEQVHVTDGPNVVAELAKHHRPRKPR